MSLIVFGFNHNSAPMEVLGKVIIPESRLPEALGDFKATVGADEAAIVSTCNRCEIYGVLKDGEDETALADWLYAYRDVAGETVESACFTYRDKAAAHHLMRVASSVDSMIVGEPQILGQVKAAYRASCDAGLAGPTLSRLFERAIEIAKKVRQETTLGKHPVSYASAAIKICKRLFEDLPSKRILLLGTGGMIELTARHFKSHGAGQIAVAGRSGDKARALAAGLGGESFRLDRMGETLHLRDVVVSCTASAAPILHRAEVAAALKKRKHKPVCMIDMALPRDVDPSVGELPDVYLYTLADLARAVDDNKQARLAAATQAETAIQLQADEYAEWTDSRKAVDVIAELLSEADGVRADALKKSLKMLHAGKPPEEALAQLSTTLTAEWTDSRKAADVIAELLSEADDVRAGALEKSLKMLHAGKPPEEALAQLSTTLTAKLMHPALDTLKRAAERGQIDLISAVRSQLRTGRKSQGAK